jgi:transcription elongation factor GreA
MTSLRLLYVSNAGRQKLQTALAEAIAAHQEICRERQVAFELSGDGWHDNPHFNYLQQLEANATRKIAELRDLLATARVWEVADGARPTDRARLGSIALLSLCNVENGTMGRRLIEIVGFQEGDESGMRVPYDAPLAAALLGKKPGDVIDVTLPIGPVEIELLELYRSTSEANQCMVGDVAD